MLPIRNKNRVKKKFIPGISGHPFNPIDVNTVALWDGDLNLTNLAWTDQIAANPITLFNLPIVNPIGLNGHGIVTFDGISQYGFSLNPLVSAPKTIYLVVNEVTWVNGGILMSDSTGGLEGLIQSSVIPNLRLFAGVNLSSNPDLSVNTWGVLTLKLNGANSTIRTNLFPGVNGNTGVNLGTGITLGTDYGTFGNVSFAYIIIRNIADNLIKQFQYITYLKSRFAL